MNNINTPPIEIGSYSKTFQATEKLKKQEQFAIIQQASEKSKGFTWKMEGCDSPVETQTDAELMYSTASAQGCHSSMEDAYFANKIGFSHNSISYEGVVYGVCDGHGGAEVSNYLKENFSISLECQLQVSYGEKPIDVVITEALTKAFVNLNKEVRRKFNSGSTMTCAFVVNNKIYVANAGDSRSILVKKETTQQLSEDAKPLDKRFWKQINAPQGYHRHEVIQIFFRGAPLQENITQVIYDVSRGKFIRNTREGEKIAGLINSNKTRLSIAIARTIGDPYFELSAKPKITSVEKENGNLLVIGSDGLWDVASSDEVGEAVRKMENQGLDEAQISSELTKSALAHGSQDNVSVLVVRIRT